jgi:hypothetical protein
VPQDTWLKDGELVDFFFAPPGDPFVPLRLSPPQPVTMMLAPTTRIIRKIPEVSYREMMAFRE